MIAKIGNFITRSLILARGCYKLLSCFHLVYYFKNCRRSYQDKSEKLNFNLKEKNKTFVTYECHQRISFQFHLKN